VERRETLDRFIQTARQPRYCLCANRLARERGHDAAHLATAARMPPGLTMPPHRPGVGTLAAPTAESSCLAYERSATGWFRAASPKPARRIHCGNAWAGFRPTRAAVRAHTRPAAADCPVLASSGTSQEGLVKGLWLARAAALAQAI
jgi:hypothetical protein